MDADDQGNIREPVGYANPPVHSRFQPGQSGNLAGRTKGRSLTAIVREVLESNTLGGKPIPQGRTVKDVLGDVIVKEALKGKFTFTKEVWDRTEGKVPDKVQHSGEGGGPVEINAAFAPAASELEAWRQQQRKNLESNRDIGSSKDPGPTTGPDDGRSNT